MTEYNNIIIILCYNHCYDSLLFTSVITIIKSYCKYNKVRIVIRVTPKLASHVYTGHIPRLGAMCRFWIDVVNCRLSVIADVFWVD